MQAWLVAALIGFVVACSSGPHRRALQPPPSTATAPPPGKSPYAPAQEDPSKRGDYVHGGLYAPHIKDSIPDHIPDVDAIPEPVVEILPRSRYGNRSPYQVLGRTYHVLEDATGFVETGIASYYGEKFHGRRTSNQEVYDMYAYTAAHKSLPLPSFARVTNLDTGQSVVVRVNDRGPFHDGRVIDLSYAAAVKIGIREAGMGRVEVRALTPEDVLPPTFEINEVNTDQMEARALTPENAPTAYAPLEVGIEQAQARASTPEDAAPAFTPHEVGIEQAQAHAPPPQNAPTTSSADHFLQVGAFSVYTNAEQALTQLHAAGVKSAALYDGEANGRRIWRLRVPIGMEDASQLTMHISRLGLGAPQLVRE